MTLAVLLAAELMVVPRFAPDEGAWLLRSAGRPSRRRSNDFHRVADDQCDGADDWKSVKAILCGGCAAARTCSVNSRV